MKKTKITKSLIVVLSFFMCVLLVCSTSAYFNFLKSFEGAGNLPVLKIDYEVTGGSVDSLKNIVYNGQTEVNLSVNLTTNGNNISGYVRVKVGFIWSNNLSNKTYSSSQQLIDACSINYDTSLWNLKNDYLYLKSPIEKDSSVNLFSKITFGDVNNSYRGEEVSIHLFNEIYQTTNLPQNW